MVGLSSEQTSTSPPVTAKLSGNSFIVTLAWTSLVQPAAFVTLANNNAGLTPPVPKVTPAGTPMATPPVDGFPLNQVTIVPSPVPITVASKVVKSTFAFPLSSASSQTVMTGAVASGAALIVNVMEDILEVQPDVVPVD